MYPAACPRCPITPPVFGHQIYMDAGNLVLGEDPRFLAGHTDIGLEEVSRLAAAFGGAAFPAHIDRPSFSLLGVLGLWMPELGFPLAEVSRQCPPEFRLRPDLAGLRSSPTLTPTTWIRSGRRSTPWSCRSGRLPPFSIGCRVQGKFFSLQT